MRRLLAAVLTLMAALTVATPARAQVHGTSSYRASWPSVFRLSVDGAVAPTDTFWVAYGPLAGTWGIIRLRPVGPHLYVARATLPSGRTVFSYIRGRGVLHTRLGAVPGNPVTTIHQVGPTQTSGANLPLVVWHEPVG